MKIIFSPDPMQCQMPPEVIEWPLFERMRFYNIHGAQKIELRQDTFINGSSGKKPVRVIPQEEFNSDRLYEEVVKLSEKGGELHLPAGQIELNEELKINSGVSIIGTAGATELIFKDTDYGLFIKGSESDVTDVRIENLKIRHEGPYKFCAAVFVSKARDLQFSHVEINSPRSIGFLFSDGVHNAYLDRCKVYNAGLVGFMMIREVCDTVLNSCVAERCQQSGVFLTDIKLPDGINPMDFDSQIHYTNKIIGNFGPFDPQDPSPCRNTLMNCSFCGNRKMGITTDGVGYLRVINCIIADNDCEGITIDNGSWGCQVHNCHIYGNGWRGLQHDIELSIDFVDEMDLMADGSAKAKLPGVSLDNAAYSHIKNNCIEGNWGDGVKFVRSVYACSVTDNIIADNNKGINDRFHFFGVLVGETPRQHPDQGDFPSCHNRIIENDITGAHHAGVHLLPGTQGNIIKENRIIGATFDSIENHSDGKNIILFNWNTITGET